MYEIQPYKEVTDSELWQTLPPVWLLYSSDEYIEIQEVQAMCPRLSNKVASQVELEQSSPDGLLAFLSLYHAVTFARDELVLSNDTFIKYLLSTYYVSGTVMSW